MWLLARWYFSFGPRKACTIPFYLCSRVMTSPPIGKTLPFHSEQGRTCPAGIINAEPDAVVVTELELGQIAVQMLLVAMLIDAFHAALEQAEVAFDSVRVDCGILKRDVLTYAVVDGAVTGKFLAYFGVVLGLVGHQPRLASDAFADDAADFLARDRLDVHGADLAAALHEPEDGVLVADAA